MSNPPPRIVGVAVSPMMGESVAMLSIQAINSTGQRVVCRFFVEPDTAALLVHELEAGACRPAKPASPAEGIST